MRAIKTRRTAPNGRTRRTATSGDVAGAGYKILLIEENVADARLVRDALATARGGPFDVVWVRRLSDALTRLQTTKVRAIFADLILPDSQGIETVDRLLLLVPPIPVVALCDMADEGTALLALQRGAQDYLLKSHLDSYTFSRALHNLIERKTIEEASFLEKERAQVTLDSIGCCAQH